MGRDNELFPRNVSFLEIFHHRHPDQPRVEDTSVNVLNLHRIDLARKCYTHLQREIEKEEAREKEWNNSHYD
jgi:hypothetical protein